MNRVEPANFTKQVFDESLVSLEEDTSTKRGTPVGNSEELDDSAKNTAENSTSSSQEICFTPHPPEKPKPTRPRNKKKRDAKRNKVGSISQSSEKEKLLHQQHNEVLSGNRIAGSKLPPLLKESSSAIENKPNADKLCNVHTLNLKPLSPIMDNLDVADNFKAKQSLERGKHDLKNKGPVKPRDPIGQVSRIDGMNEEANRFQVDKNLDINKQKSISNNNKDNDSDEDNKSEKTLSSVSSNDLVSDTDSDGPDNPKTSFYTKAPERMLTIFIGTWNMHGEKQLPAFVDDFLRPECSQFMQDLYVIGSQESTPSRKEWEIKLQEALGPSHVLIHSCVFGVLHLAMFLRSELVWFCSAAEQATVATRPGHMIKTKGALGLALSIFGTSFLFINSHFTGQDKKWKERIGDYRLIRKTLSLPLNYQDSVNQEEIDVTSRFNQVFWLGDFNFRVDERHGVVVKLLEQYEEDDDPNYEELVAKDQMTKIMKKNGVFEHFQEATINFPPTYKFDINPDDPGHYSSIRTPSWTDRIVYRSSEENGVRPLHYDCCSTINISDHRPVFGIFEATINPVKEGTSFTVAHFDGDGYIEEKPNPSRPRNKKKLDAKCNKVGSISQSSEEEKLLHQQHNEVLSDNRIAGSKLPPLSKESTSAIENKPKDDKLCNVHTLNLKPLSPIIDNLDVADNFKAKQSLERGKHDLKNKGPVKRLDPISQVSRVDSINEEANRFQVDENLDINKQKSISNNNKDNDSDEDNKSEKSFTSVSSNDLVSDTDSDGPDSPKTPFYPKAPSDTPPTHHRPHRNSLSLTSVKDCPEPVDRHSDTEAIRRARNGNRQSKELWGEAKVVTLLPRVPAARARDRNSNFVKEELEKYLPERKLTVFIGTWNMHGEKQLPAFVDDFLLPDCSQDLQDLYVIGSQESTPSRKEWEIKLQEALGPSHVLIYSCAFGVLHLAMFLRRELVWFCSAVEQATVATRPGHMIKTKGALGLALSIFGTSFLFINSHFTARDKKVKERIGDYRLIRKTLSLPLNYQDSVNQEEIDVTSRFNQVFWLGDFNFRVDERHGVAVKLLEQYEEDDDPNYEELVAKDQMTKIMKKNGVFEHFQEATINFPPTYRFDINPDDPGHYSSIRTPSWTDRIVYRSSEENGVRPLHYDCCSTINISDHRPVFGIFEATIKPVKERISFTGVHFVRDVYVEANRRRAAPPRNQRQTAVCTIL